MHLIKNNLSLSNGILNSSFIIYSFLGILSLWSEFGEINPFINTVFISYQYICIVILGCIYVFKKHTLENWLFFMFSFLYGVLIVYQTHDFHFFLFILFFFSSINCDTSKILKWDFVEKSIVFLLIIISSGIGILPDIISVRNGMKRQTLGFTHPNALIYIYMMIVVEWLLIRKQKISFLEVAIILGLGFYFSSITNSRGALLFVFIFGLLGWLSTKIKKKYIFKSPLIKWGSILLPEFLSLFTLIINMTREGSNLYNSLQSITSYRLEIFKFYLQTYGINLLPQKISGVYIGHGMTIAGIDNLYLYLLIYTGIIGWLIYCIIYAIIMNCAIKEKNFFIFFLMIMFSFLGLIESIILYPFIGIFVLFNKSIFPRKKIYEKYSS